MTQPTNSPLPLDQDAAEPRPGDEVGRYRLVRKIGQGGMGQVWLAHDPVLAIDVALKMIRVAEVGVQGAQRLLREARAAAQIGHEGIVRVLDYGNSTDGMSYLVMELLQGESFADMLDRQRFVEPVKAVQMVLPLLDALAVAHERGIIHRDLKPENFFLAQDAAGRVLPKVLDFGIAKADLTPGRLTRTGIVMGTPAFMAPEQVRGEEPLEPCADLWSLTVSLYEMIAGKLPFADSDYAALLWAICNQAPASLAGQRGVDDELWAIIERGLARDRSERWTSARAYADALAGWLQKMGIYEDISGTLRRPTAGVRRSSPSLEGSSTSFVISPSARQLYETAEAPTARASELELSLPEIRLSAGLRSTASTEAVPVSLPSSEVVSSSDLSVPGVSRESLASQAMQVPMVSPRSRVGVVGALALGAVLLMGAAWGFRSTPASADTSVAAASPVVPSAEPSSVPMITLAAPLESAEPTPAPPVVGGAPRPAPTPDPYSRVSARQEPARALPPLPANVPASKSNTPRRPGKGNWY